MDTLLIVLLVISILFGIFMLIVAGLAIWALATLASFVGECCEAVVKGFENDRTRI